MTEPLIVPQREYSTIEEFAEDSNNFFAYFLDDCDYGEMKRGKPHFKRFQEANPDLEEVITKEVVRCIRQTPRLKLPYPQLWEAYKLMSQFVFISDPYVEVSDPTIFHKSDSTIEIDGKHYKRIMLII